MADVEVDGKIFPDRKNGNGRLRLHVNDWIKIIGVFAAAVFGYATLVGTVAAHSSTIAKQGMVIDEVKEKVIVSENNITNIKENLIYIRGKLDVLTIGLK